MDNQGKEVGGLKGNGDCSFGEPSNVEIGEDSDSSEQLRGANLLQGGHDRDYEEYDGLETKMEKFQGTNEEDGMEWEKPTPNWYKLNTDEASCGNPRRAGGGGVIRGSAGNWIKGFVRYIGSTTSIIAEFRALRDGL
nr:putative ribonuclease h protein [Quercus suber]